MCELQSGMKIGDKGNVLLKFNAAATRDAHHIVNVSLVKLRYCTSVLLTDLFFYISYKKTRVIWVLWSPLPFVKILALLFHSSILFIVVTSATQPTKLF